MEENEGTSINNFIENKEIIKESIEEELEYNEIKNKVGRPKGIPASDKQKETIRRVAREYQQKIRDGLITPPEYETHGAYSYMKKNKITKNKKHLLEFVYKERGKWLNELGGEDNLSTIELSMIDEACRLLLYSTMINEYLLSNKKQEIMYTDENGEVKMHSALSRNYLSFTKTYIGILKELLIISKNKIGKGGIRNDVALKLQALQKKS